MKDSKKDFIAAILAIVIILLVIIIVLVSYGIFSNKNEKVNIYEEEEKSIEVFGKVDDGKEEVYDEKINYTLDFDSVKFEINSVMPVINIKSDKIKLINDEIKKYYESVKLNEEMYELSYNKYEYDNILSVVISKIEKRSDNIKNISNVLVYNIDKESGELVSNREIINKKGTNIEKLCLELLNAIKKDLKNNYKFDISDESILIDNKKTAEEYIKESISIDKDENLGNNLKLYLNSKGNICVCYYVPILNLNNKFTYNTFLLNI